MQKGSSFYKPLNSREKKPLILVVNSGSSSLKLSIFQCDADCHRLLDVTLSGLNSEQVELEIYSSLGKERELFSKNVEINQSIPLIFETLKNRLHFVPDSLVAIGHRFVHGGSKFLSSTLITDTVLHELEELSSLAPLHNLASVAAVKACLNYFGKSIIQVAAFDTAFFRALPALASCYAINQDIAKKYSIRRYGFHGISHAFLWSAYRAHSKEATAESKVITLHLGNGCSMTAMKGGIPCDTSMGFTPAEGLVMGTRAGDIDAAVVDYLCLKEKKSPSEVMHFLNYQSGLLGLSGISSDMSSLLELYDTSARVKEAIDLFCYRILKYLGAYIAVLGGVDAIIFSGGIGENSPRIRQLVIQNMAWYGVEIDEPANSTKIHLLPGAVRKISRETSKCALFVIATDENRFIAKDVRSLLL